MSSHDFYWFRLTKGEEVPAWHEERLPREELPLLVLFDGWYSFMRDRVVPWRMTMSEKVRTQLETEALPRFLETQRWYAAKGEPVKRATLIRYAEWKEGSDAWMMALFRIGAGTEDDPMYFAPLALVWEDGDDERMRGVMRGAISRVRQQARMGVLADAFYDDVFCRAVLEAIRSNKELGGNESTIHFRSTSALMAQPSEDGGPLAVHLPGAQSSNTTVTIGDRFFLKGYRRLRIGVSPELEVGRFLTEVAKFPHIVPVLGWVELVYEDVTITLALLQRYLENQGDGWSYTLDYLQWFLGEQRASPNAAAGPAAEMHAGYLRLIETLGTRTAELHKALATPAGDPMFEPEPMAAKDISGWVHNVKEEAAVTFDLLQARLETLAETARTDAEALLARRVGLLERVVSSLPRHIEATKIRFHGDYHLGQVLLVHNDFVIIDFEGEPARPPEERRSKHSPFKDVAGMIRSFNYAAYAALVRATAERPDDFSALEPVAEHWETEVCRVFLDAYMRASGDSGLYASWDEAQQLLRLFLLEKALYELRYELSNRPDWVHIPLRGLLRLASEDRAEQS